MSVPGRGGRAVGDSEDETFWGGFLTSLEQRGLSGVTLVISDQRVGLQLLRVAARTRAEHGLAAVGRYDEQLGRHMREGTKPVTGAQAATGESLASVLAAAELAWTLAGARHAEKWDGEIGAETEEALSLTGKDVGMPILHFSPPDGSAFFGPVISRLPSDEDALRLWDHVVGLSQFLGIAELKRSLRERMQLPAFGVPAKEAAVQEDWHGGIRRLKK